MNHNHIDPGTPIPLFLTRQEHAEIVYSSIAISSELKKRIRLGEAKDDGVLLHLSLDELEELHDGVLTEIERCTTQSAQILWFRIFDKIQELLESHVDDENNPPVDDMASVLPPDLAEEIRDTLSNKQFESLEEANAALSEIMMKYNRQPRDEFGGLSSEQVFLLIHSDWNDPNGVIRFATNLSLDDLTGSPHLVNARLFLAALDEEKKVKATTAGNLNRKFVGQMIECFTFRDGYKEDIYRYNKVKNEWDISPLHTIRIVCEFAGLIKKQKDYFSITKKGQKLLSDERANELFLLLFKTHFLKFNLAYLDCAIDNEPLQNTIAYSFLKVKQHHQDWLSSDEAAPFLLIPAAYEISLSTGFDWYPEMHAFSRILRPLEAFGLLDSREIKKEGLNIPITEFKLTPLFDKFIQFVL